MALQELDLSGVTKDPENLIDNENSETDIDDNDDFILNLLQDDGDEDEDEEVLENDQEEDDGDADDPETEQEEISEEDDEAGDAEEEDDGDDEEDPKEEEGRTRYNKRIQQVITQRNEERARAQKLAEEQREWQKKYQELQQEMVSSQVSLLEQNKDALKTQIIQATEQGDSAKAIDLQEKLTQVTTQIQAYNAWKPDEISEDVDAKASTQQQQEIPIALEEWLMENPWFQNQQTDEDIEKAAIADAYSRVLLKKGYTYEDPDLYELVDEKLSSLGLAKGKTKMLKSKNKSSETDVKNKQTKKPKKKVSQIVQGSSRSTTATSKAQNSKKKITLTREQQNIADVMGISYKEYADELRKIEEAEQKGSRMTPLKLK